MGVPALSDHAVAAARRRVEKAMTTHGVLYRDTGHAQDDVLDEETLLLARPAGDEDEVWEGDVAFMRATALRGDRREGSVEVSSRRCLFPVAAPLERGLVFVVTASRHDPSLVDRRYRVREVEDSSQTVGRVAVLDNAVAPR